MKKIFFSAAFSLMALGCMADFTEDFQNAQKLFNQRKWNDAADSFEKIAQRASVGAKDKCYSYAARALAQSRKWKEAEETAGKIQDANWKKYTQLEILSASGKFKEIVERFQAEKIDDWPEEIAYHGFYLRGRAMEGNRALSKEAVSDLKKSLAQCGSDERTRILVLGMLTGALRNAGDMTGAIETADKALTMKKFKGFHPYLNSAIQKTQILIAQKKFDEAGKTLDALDGERKWNGGAWQLIYLESRGDLASAEGNMTEAKKWYVQAQEIKNGVHPGHIRRVTDKLNKIK